MKRVLNKCASCVYFTFVQANKVGGFTRLGKKASGEAGLSGGKAGRLKQALNRVQSHSGSLVSLLDI